jgi:transcriptional regulator with XRE-family HTH domain
MEIFGQRLRERARQLGISNAEAARRCGLEERRYANYVTGSREPDLETLVKIAQSLGTTVHWLLGLDAEGRRGTRRAALLDRLMAAGQLMSETQLQMFVVQAEALGRAGGT